MHLFLSVRVFYMLSRSEVVDSICLSFLRLSPCLIAGGKHCTVIIQQINYNNGRSLQLIIKLYRAECLKIKKPLNSLTVQHIQWRAKRDRSEGNQDTHQPDCVLFSEAF